MHKLTRLVAQLEATGHDLGQGKTVWVTLQLMQEAANAIRKLQEVSEPTDPRKEAMSVYKPPFTFLHGYIYDSQHLMVADDGPITGEGGVAGAVAARVRGWGKLGYRPDGAKIQDEIGQMMADALNEYYAARQVVV
jgi:hypothetical protein